jgi:hypothetical protein
MFIGIALLVASVLVDALNPNIAEKFMKKNAAASASAAAAVSSSAAAAPQPLPPSTRRSQQPQSSDSDSDEENAPLLAAAQPPSSSASSSSGQSQSNNSSGSSGSHGGHHGAGARDPHSVNHFMFRTNVYVVPLLLLGVLVSGELRLVASRVAIFPHVIPLFVLYCTASYAGIHSYTSMIARHGSVLTVGMATLRKICTIVLSYLFIGSTALVTSSSTATNSGAPVSAPQKHFGSQHLFPSLLILLGLLLSAWVDRKKGTDAPTATPASAASSSSAASGAALARRGSSSGSAALTSRALSGAPSMQPQGHSSAFGTKRASHESSSRRDSQSSIGSAAAADDVGVVGSAQQHVRALAAELGLETGGETECDTDVEQQQQSKSNPQRTTVMAKHAPHLSAQLARDMWGAHDDADDAI